VSMKPPHMHHRTASEGLACRDCCAWIDRRLREEERERRLAKAEWVLLAVDPLQ
jgi:hypothetical protein